MFNGTPLKEVRLTVSIRKLLRLFGSNQLFAIRHMQVDDWAQLKRLQTPRDMGVHDDPVKYWSSKGAGRRRTGVYGLPHDAFHVRRGQTLFS